MAETEWQLIDDNDAILYQGILDPRQTRLQQIIEINSDMEINENCERYESKDSEGNENNCNNEAASIRFIVKYAKEGYLSIESFQLNHGTDNILTLQGKDFNCAYLGYEDGRIREYYIDVGRQEFYALNPYHNIVVHNNTSIF